MKQKATKLDVDAPKLSRQRRAPTRTEEFFGRKSAPDYDTDVISNYYRTSFETLDCIINLQQIDMTRQISEYTSNSKIFC